MADPDSIEFTVKCRMRKRWVPHFLGLLKVMQRLGGFGSSRWVHFFSDGDGDYRPTFEFDADLPSPADGNQCKGGEVSFDAG